jgi:hypothetical protein
MLERNGLTLRLDALKDPSRTLFGDDDPTTAPAHRTHFFERTDHVLERLDRVLERVSADTNGTV